MGWRRWEVGRRAVAVGVGSGGFLDRVGFFWVGFVYFGKRSKREGGFLKRDAGIDGWDRQKFIFVEGFGEF